MPEHLKNYMAWYEGSPATLEVGEWLKTNRAQLSWNEKQQRYTFPSSESKDLV